ncbi:DUF502 domain-containing protein [Chelatococcus sambhunathii]|uniref:DUF502 domain-containing protein n=1 Tax=Chelatococcus sambhunathii TaxID=363953 RepID=A0ABU1DEB9_9HYPH|nr:DUF502 domain-containing protein [Chelatococcus sambhunathii]MDR4306422.1 DUF502 domain-containing protein [Chelatococcus sambhunathii]
MTQSSPGPLPNALGSLGEPVPPPKPHGTARLRNYFLTGLVVAGPVAITIWLTLWLINLIDGWVKPLIPPAWNPNSYLPVAVPGVGVLAAVIGLTILGALTANLVGRTIVQSGESVLDRMPVVRSLYKGVKQIFETVFKQDGTSFRRVGLIEWPGPGMWSICFITEPARGALAAGLPGPDHVCLFVPCTPNPTTGYLVMMEESKVVEIGVTSDEAFKLIMSMGIIQPPDLLAPTKPEAPPSPPASAEPARRPEEAVAAR